MNETETFGRWRACEEDEDFQQKVGRKTGESERNRKTRGRNQKTGERDRGRKECERERWNERERGEIWESWKDRKTEKKFGRGREQILK